MAAGPEPRPEPDPEWSRIGRLVRERRLEMDLSASERARALGIPRTLYAWAEAGRIDPRELLGVDEHGRRKDQR